MQTSQNGINLIKSSEGCKLQAYKDVVGVVTIGYGHTEAGLQMGTTWTQDQVDQALAKDLVKFEKAVTAACKVSLTQNQFDALVCFSYNIGAGAMTGSTLVKKINAGDFAAAALEFSKWNKAGGKEVAGLTRRREAEKNLFSKGVESKSDVLGDGPSDLDINSTLSSLEKGIMH